MNRRRLWSATDARGGTRFDMKHLRPADYRRMPWKNGGGETTEIAIWPPLANLDAFDWRVSMAPVKSDGAFSTFDGIDRTLCILEGQGMRLKVGDAPPADVTASAAPLTFPADQPTYATLMAGEILDLNVMTRRAVFEHDVRRLHYRGLETIKPHGATFIALCHTGTVSISTPKGNVVLKAGDSLMETEPSGTWSLSSKVPSVMFLISIMAKA